MKKLKFQDFFSIACYKETKFLIVLSVIPINDLTNILWFVVISISSEIQNL